MSAISILNRPTNPEQCHSIVLQEANGGGAGGRETGRESADAVPASRGSRQGGVSDDSIRTSGWRAGVRSGQQATVVGDGVDPSWGGTVGLPLRSTAASRRANLLKRDDEPGESRRVKIVFFGRVASDRKEKSERVGGYRYIPSYLSSISIYVHIYSVPSFASREHDGTLIRSSTDRL